MPGGRRGRVFLRPPAGSVVENLSVPLWDGPVLMADHVNQHVGINVGTSADYMDDRQQTADQVEALGFRLVRSPRVAPGNAEMRDLTAKLFAKGIRGTCQVDDFGSPTVALRVQEALGVNAGAGYPVGYIKHIRSRNEGNADPWLLNSPADSTTSTASNVSIAQCHRETSEAWAAVQGVDPSVTVSLPAPAAKGKTTWWPALAQLSWSAITNRNDIHGYFDGYGPTLKAGTTVPGYLAALRAQGAAFADAPCDLTECGGHDKMDTLATHKPTPKATAAFLYLRALYDILADNDADLDKFRELYFFQLKNQPGEGAGTASDHEAAFGMYEDDGVTEKPLATALRRILALHHDPGADFTPRVPRVSVSGLGADDTRKLYQRRDGTWLLELHRRDVTNWDPSQWNREDWLTGGTFSDGFVSMAPAKDVTVTLSVPRAAVVWAPSQQGTLLTTTLGESLTVSLRQHVTLIELGTSPVDILPV